MVWGLCKFLLLSVGSTYYPQADTASLNARTCKFSSHFVSLHARYGRHKEKKYFHHLYLWGIHLHLQNKKQKVETQPREMARAWVLKSQSRSHLVVMGFAYSQCYNTRQGNKFQSWISIFFHLFHFPNLSVKQKKPQHIFEGKQKWGKI